MSSEKPEKSTRSKKRGAAAAAVNAQYAATSKRASISQHSTPPPQSSNIIPVNQIKESPPSSPSSESQGIANTRASRSKGRKNAPTTSVAVPKDNKDLKVCVFFVFV